jgi:predicted secreted protein
MPLDGAPIRSGRGDRRIALAVFLLALLVYNANLRDISTGDSFPARFLPLALLCHGTLYLGPVAEAVRMEHQGGPLEVYWLVAARGGRVASRYPIVMPLLVTPLYVPTALYLAHHGWGNLRDVEIAGELTEKAAAAAVAALCSALMYLLLRRQLPRGRALLLTLAFAFGTETWSISSQALWQHGAAELFAIAALLAATGKPTRLALAAAGAASGLLIATRPPDLILAAGFAAYAALWARPRRRALWFVTGAAVPLALLAAYDYALFGTIHGGYGVGTAEILLYPLWTGLAGELFSPGKGIFVYMPFLLFLLLLPVGLRRQLPEPDPAPATPAPRTGPSTRALALCVAAAAALQILFYAKADWRAGWCYGPRFATDMLPLLAWLLAPVVAMLGRRGLACFAAAACLAVFIQAVGVFCYPRGASDARLAAAANAADPRVKTWSWPDAPPLVEARAGLARPFFIDILAGKRHYPGGTLP